MSHYQLPRATPESQGVSSLELAKFVDALDTELEELHSVMVVRHGHVVAEGWWQPYEADLPHLLYSLTKSFTSTAVGLAEAQGLLSLDDKVVSYFPGLAPARPSRHLAALKVRHLLTMCSGRLTDSIVHAVTDRSGNWVKGFFAQPWLQAPGEPFSYDSGASHLLGVIVEKVAQTDLQTYLTPLLFDPLGIQVTSWETDPQGHRTGGFGLSLKTEDIAKFGQLYLQKGNWQGRQLIPAGWVEKATSKQVGNDRFAPNSNADWRQGYGYQFWQGSHGSYRADGAFGQFCIVVPGSDLVVAITAALNDTQKALDRVWHLLPSLSEQPLPADPARNKALRIQMGGLTLPLPAGEPRSQQEPALSARKFRLEGNTLGVRDVWVEFEENHLVLTMVDKHGTHLLEAGRALWRESFSDIFPKAELFYPKAPVANARVRAAFLWTGPKTLVITARLIETPFAYTLTFGFEEGRLHLGGQVNVTLGAPATWPRLVGVGRKR